MPIRLTTPSTGGGGGTTITTPGTTTLNAVTAWAATDGKSLRDTPGMLITSQGSLQSAGVGNGSVVGNARGTNATDLQTGRTAATQVASGTYSFTAGFGCTASGNNSVAIGNGSTANSANSFAFGQNCLANGVGSGALAIGLGANAAGSAGISIGNSSTCAGASGLSIGNSTAANGSTSVAIGTSVTASTTNAVCVGVNSTSGGSNSCTFGADSFASTTDSLALGRFAFTRFVGHHAYSNGRFSITGDSQASMLLQRGTTSDATPTALVSPATLVLPSDTGWLFDVQVVARNINSDEMGAYFIQGCVQNAGGVATLVGVPAKVAYESVAAWDAEIIVSGLEMRVRVTGEAGKSIRWVAKVNLVELSA